MTRRFRVRKTVEAMYMDGTRDSAFDVAGWIGETADIEEGENGFEVWITTPLITGERMIQQCTKGKWVLKAALGFRVWSDREFREFYEEIGPKPPRSKTANIVNKGGRVPRRG